MTGYQPIRGQYLLVPDYYLQELCKFRLLILDTVLSDLLFGLLEVEVGYL